MWICFLIISSLFCILHTLDDKCLSNAHQDNEGIAKEGTLTPKTDIQLNIKLDLEIVDKRDQGISVNVSRLSPTSRTDELAKVNEDSNDNDSISNDEDTTITPDVQTNSTENDMSLNSDLVKSLKLDVACGIRTETSARFRRDADEDSPDENEFRIFNGIPAELKSWPWQASIRVMGQHLCGGSLISGRYVVTASHCDLAKYIRRYPKNVTLHFGTLSLDSHGPFEQIRNAIQIMENPKFNKKIKYNNDIALVQMDKEVVMNEYVSPICLPNKPTTAGTLCYASGYGQTQEKTTNRILNEVRIPIISQQQCSSSQWLGDFVNDNMICAGGSVKDSCQGDSGGPLQCMEDTSNGSSEWVLSGIVSWGEGCGIINKPGVYTNVVNYLRWLNSQVSA